MGNSHTRARLGGLRGLRPRAAARDTRVPAGLPGPSAPVTSASAWYRPAVSGPAVNLPVVSASAWYRPAVSGPAVNLPVASASGTAVPRASVSLASRPALRPPGDCLIEPGSGSLAPSAGPFAQAVGPCPGASAGMAGQGAAAPPWARAAPVPAAACGSLGGAVHPSPSWPASRTAQVWVAVMSADGSLTASSEYPGSEATFGQEPAPGRPPGPA